MSYKHYSSSIGTMTAQLVFVPKYRHKIFSHEQIKRRCSELFRSIAKQYGMEIIEEGFNIDHVHLVVDLGNKTSAAKAAQLLKGISARFLFEEFPWLRSRYFWGGHLWSPAYFFGSVGKNLDDTRAYVRNQDN